MRLFVIAAVLLAGQVALSAQRLREFDVWTSEAYARLWITPDVTSWDNLKGWVVDSTYGLYNMQPDHANPGQMIRVAASGRPDYSLNYENVRSLMVGRYYGMQDTTINGETQYVTPIPSIMLLQSIPRVGPPGIQRMQIFSVESRGYRVTNPTDSRPRDGGSYRDNNIEGLGIRRDALDSAIVSKYDIMLEGSNTTHPTILRYDDATIDPQWIMGAVSGNVRGDVRDEIILLYDDGAQSIVYQLSNDSLLNHVNPLDYILTRTTAATWAYGTFDVRKVTHTVAGDFDGNGTDEVAIYWKDGTDQRVYLLQAGTPWTVTQVAAPSVGSVDFANVMNVARADIDGDGNDEIAILMKSGAAVMLMAMESAGGWGLHPLTYTFPTADASPTRVFGLTAGNTDNAGADEVLVMAQRQVSGTITASHLMSCSIAGGVWQTKTVSKWSLAALNASRVKYLFSGNLDYDVRRREDVGIMYMSSGAAAEADQLIVMNSLPTHLENDFAVDTTSALGVTAPFLPLGWYGVRLHTGIPNRTGGILDTLYFRDQWRSETWRSPADYANVVGINFTADSGMIDDRQLDDYARIYNTISAERLHFTDDRTYMGDPVPAADTRSAAYFYNSAENVTGLTAYMNRAWSRRLRVLPHLSCTEHDAYDRMPVSFGDRKFENFDWSTTETGAGAGTLPNYFGLMMNGTIENHPGFLGWYASDEPSNLLGPTWQWHIRFRTTATALRTPLNMPPMMRSYYRTMRWRTPGKPIYMNYNWANDFEYYRNSHDVNLFDNYVYGHTFTLDTLRAGGVPVIANGRPVISSRTQDPAQSLNEAAVLYGFLTTLWNQVKATQRCDKEAAMVIVQGRGDDYVGRDTDPRNNEFLRSYQEMRNLSPEEARFNLFGPAVLGARGALWWEATSWMQGASTDTRFTTTDGGTDPMSGQPRQHAANNMTLARAQRVTIDNASAEFSHYAKIFLNERLQGRVSTSAAWHMQGANIPIITTALHLDTASSTYWLFVVNNSARAYGENGVPLVDLAVSGLPGSSIPYLVGREFWQNGQSERINTSTMNDGILSFSTPMRAYEVRIYALSTFAPVAPGVPIPVDGELSWVNQRKMILYAHEAGVGVAAHLDNETRDSVVYHAVYHRADCDTCPVNMQGQRVYYRKSFPMHRTEPVDIIRWRPEEHCVSCLISDPALGTTGTGTCAYPSLVVRYDPVLLRARVYVTYACEFNGSAYAEHPITGLTGNIRIVENVFLANPDIPVIPPGQVISMTNGMTIHDIGFPVVAAVGDGNIYSYSDAIEGIHVGWKAPGAAQFAAGSLRYIRAGNLAAYGDNHPSLWSYGRLHQNELEVPLVWQGADVEGGASQVFYTRAYHSPMGLMLYTPDYPAGIEPFPVVAGGQAFVLSQGCGDHFLPSVLRSPKQAANRINDIVYWQNYRDPMCTSEDGKPGGSFIKSTSVLTEDVNANRFDDQVALPQRHTISHKFEKLYSPNLTHGRAESTDATYSDRVAVSMNSNSTFIPPMATSMAFRLSSIWWLHDHVAPFVVDVGDVNLYWRHMDTTLVPKVRTADWMGAVPHQSVSRRPLAYEDYNQTRMIAEYGLNGTAHLGLSRLFYYMRMGSGSEAVSYGGVTNGTGAFVGIEGVRVNGEDVAVGYERHMDTVASNTVTSLVSGWFTARGRTNLALTLRQSHPGTTTFMLEDERGKRVPLQGSEMATSDDGREALFSLLTTGGRYRVVADIAGSVTYERNTLIGANRQSSDEGGRSDDPVMGGANALVAGGNGAVTVNLTESDGLVIAPNPASAEANVILPASIMEHLTATEPMTVQVISQSGSVVDAPIMTGSGYASITTTGLASGVYTVRVVQDGVVMTGRLTVMH